MKKVDKLIFWGVLFLSCAMLFASNLLFGNVKDTRIVILLNGKEYASYAQNALTSPKQLEIKTENGYNKIILSEEGAKIKEADCRDGQCIGMIKNAGEMLVCLPHRLVIKIDGKSEVDGVAY